MNKLVSLSFLPYTRKKPPLIMSDQILDRFDSHCRLCVWFSAILSSFPYGSQTFDTLPSILRVHRRIQISRGVPEPELGQPRAIESFVVSPAKIIYISLSTTPFHPYAQSFVISSLGHIVLFYSHGNQSPSRNGRHHLSCTILLRIVMAVFLRTRYTMKNSAQV